MLKKLISLTLVCLLPFVLPAKPVMAGTRAEKEARFAEELKGKIAKIGTGEAAQISVTLRDKRKLEGYISEAGDQYFTIVDPKVGTATQVAYPQVKQAKGRNQWSGQTITFAIAIAAILIIGIIVGTKGTS